MLIEQKYNRKLIIMLYLTGIINYLDRAAMALAIVYISTELSLNSFDKGLIFSAFSVGYLMFNFLGGYLSDRMPPAKLLLICVIVWSIFTGLTGVANSLSQLIIIRIIFGMSEGPLSSNINKIVNHLFDAKDKVAVVSLIDSSTPIGTAIAGIIVPLISLKISWRFSFFVIMLFGLIWSIIFKFLFSNLINERSSSTKIGKFRIKLTYSQKLKIVLTTFCYFIYNYLLYFLITWFPVYVLSNRALGGLGVSIINSLPWLLGSIAMLVGGLFIRNLKFKNITINKYLFIMSLSIVASGLGVILLGNSTLALSILVSVSISVFFLYFTGGMYWGLINETVFSENVGTIGGMMHGIANIASVIAPIFTGLFLGYTNSYSSLFMITGMVGVLGGLSVLGTAYGKKL